MDKGKIDLFRFGVILRLLSEKNEERGSCFRRTSGDYLPGPGMGQDTPGQQRIERQSALQM